MIRINRGPAPTSLTTANGRLRRTNEAAYLTNKRGYNSGIKSFDFTAAYRSSAVKSALRRAQHNKCCFSEAKFVNDDFHVEHFRPKGRVDTYPSGPSSYPGYYWLAYEWSNLMLCKSNTNSSRKRNFFPLMTGKRNKSHQGRRHEQPVLIDPSSENPRDHIKFKDSEIVGITDRGKQTIEILNLRNGDIDEVRRTKFQTLLGMKNMVDLLVSDGYDIHTPQIVALLTSLRASIQPEAEFSSMALDLLSGWPHL